MVRRLREDQDMTPEDDRYERRLVEETSKLRVELAGVEARLIEKTSQLEVRLSDRVAQSESSLRREINGVDVKMERLRSDVLKWAFAFWLGQLGTIAGIVIALLR